MKVFISWSGLKSKTLAIALKDWLQKVIQSVDPWVSALDIDAGDRWNEELVKALSECAFGISIVTPDNIEEPWLLFEAGALAKSLREKQWLCPYVLGIEFAQLSSPLKQFQAKATNRADTFQLVETLNKRSERPLKDSHLQETFEKFWPDLERKIKEVQAMENPVTPTPLNPADAQKEILAELRNISERLATIEAARTVGIPAISSLSRNIPGPLTKKDVQETFGVLPDFSPEAVEAQVESLLYWLTRHGIKTRDDVLHLVHDEATLKWLREIYQKELLRESKTPLDPLAVATWGAFLHASKGDRNAKEIIIAQLQQSPEYKAKHQ